MIVGGYPTTVAARLSAMAAARVGSGLVSLLVSEVALPIYASAVTSVMVKPYDSIDAFKALVAEPRINSFVIGPGAGVNEQTTRQTLSLLALSKPIVIDADALTVFQEQPEALFKQLTPECVLTPHEGEFSRLFKRTENKVDSVKLAAQKSNAVVLLKGNKTVIAAPDGTVFVNKNAPIYLATGGSGDVLAGLIAGLMAQGMPTLYAAAAATWIHSEAAKLFGIGLIAEDLPALVPQVLQKLYASES